MKLTSVQFLTYAYFCTPFSLFVCLEATMRVITKLCKICLQEKRKFQVTVFVTQVLENKVSYWIRTPITALINQYL